MATQIITVFGDDCEFEVDAATGEVLHRHGSSELVETITIFDAAEFRSRSNASHTDILFIGYWVEKFFEPPISFDTNSESAVE